MKEGKELKDIIEKLIDFDNIRVEFKVEFKERRSKKTYVLTENENAYLLEIKKGNRPLRINLNSSEDLRNQKDISDEDKRIFSELFDRLNSNQVDKVSIGGLKLRNPILTASIGQSIIANVSKQISSEDRIELYRLWKEKVEEFRRKLKEIVIKHVTKQVSEMIETPDNFERLQKIKKDLDRMIDISNIKGVEFKKDRKSRIKIKFIKNNTRNPQITLKNPILDASLRQAVTSNLSNILNGKEYEEVRNTLYESWKKSKGDKNKKEEFDLFLRDIVVDMIFEYVFKLKNKDKDLPTPIFPTSVASSEMPNYYICEPKEAYTLNIKIELFKKLAESTCGRIRLDRGGERIYGLYVPEDSEEGAYTKDFLKGYKNPDGLVDILRIAGVGRINLREIGPFEYVFYLLDRVLQEMFRRNKIPDFQVELMVQEKRTRQGKPFFSHYVIPNLNDVFFKLYHGNDRYTSYGISKIKALISSFLVESWNIDNNLKKNNSENNSEIAHAHIDRLLYFIFCHRKLDMDSILFLEDLKIKLGDTTPIRYLEEVISWM